MNQTVIDLRYPIGRFEPQPYADSLRKEWLNDIQSFPTLFEHAVENLDAAQLDTPYREGGWTVRQVVHHVGDSHINALCRLKLTLTEDNPTIRPYDESRWAQTAEYDKVPINVSLTLLHALHIRLYELFASVQPDQWQRTYFHPEANKQFTLWYLLGNYAWHGKHHTAHITSLRKRNGW